MTQVEMTEAAFIAKYGHVPVQFGNFTPMPLATGLLFEAEFCKVEEEDRSDESARVRFLAKRVGNALAPEDRYLIPAEED